MNAYDVARNDTAQDASAGCARRYWARTTASFQHRVWCSVSQPRMRLTATYWSQGSPAWWLGRCRWLPASTCLSTHRRTPNRPNSNLERAELKADDKGEHKELAAIYVARGLDPSLAKQVAQQLMAHDALGAHARDELGISETLRARPIQAALASAGSFAVGAAMPLLVTAMAPAAGLIPLVSGTSLVFLALLGGLAARAGGAGVTMGAIRVTFWGALAMAVTAGVGSLFGTVAVSGTNKRSLPRDSEDQNTISSPFLTLCRID